ncbi:thioredoxin family protein [Butyricimonas virosa]|uniref:thioredoxin family protein n=1 Tax=Butyricimonas virosa TaxID=544645 RepID=UPI0022E9785D|nr:thioredoxin domain-containing protein [Butyricimonas virosa]
MKYVMIVLTFMFLGLSNVNAQGILFHNGTFEEVRTLAKQQGKMVFIDFYTEWCGPCKMLAKSVFTDSAVGAYFNKMFVCCQLDAEKEGKDLALKYGVSAYPTLLFVTEQGDVINKVVGSVGVEQLLEVGKEAVLLVNDPNNLTNLKKRYAAEKGDEAFLKMYIDKMIEFKEAPFQAIEEYLKIQTSMRENGSKMMEYFLEHANYLLLGGEAERIVDENLKEYMDIATSVEEKKLKDMKPNMIRRTQQMALYHKDPAMYEMFIDRWKKMDEKPYYQDYNDLRLDLMLLKGERKAYRKEAPVYLDSIVDSRSVEEIRLADQERYEEYCKENRGGGFMVDMMKASMKNLDAGLQVRAIMKVGTEWLNGAKKSDFKRYAKWIEHGKRLLPEDYQVYNLESDVLYRQGKKREAIEAKQRVLEMVDLRDKVYPRIVDELEKMKKGTY